MNVNPKVRTENLTIRLTPMEKHVLLQKAKMLGLSVTGFIVMECVGEQIGQMIVDGYERRKNDK